MRPRWPFASSLLAALSVAAVPVVAGEIPGALVVLEAPSGAPGSVEMGSPARFVLMKDGQVFVGGTNRLETTRLDKDDLAAVRKRIEAARKAAGRATGAAFGGDETKAIRLRLGGDGPLDLRIDPTDTAPALSPLTALVRYLLRYHHPGLVPYEPASYALLAREGRLAGGCRRWSFAVPIDQAVAGPVTVSALDAATWPTGAWPASVCAGDKRYVATLRPLLPGERP